MGLTNDVLKELKKEVIKADNSISDNINIDSHHSSTQEKLSLMYQEIECWNSEYSNAFLAKKIVLIIYDMCHF